MRQTATQFQMPGMANALSISSRRSFDTEPWAAFYCRLSQDDGLDGESNSIQHQKQILERYAKEHGIKKYKFYVDDGISGTTFNRPGFQEMLADIEAGYVYMVVVKDMSRFGRDYLQVGMYTEVLFPEKDIHFVAINDGVDSEKGDNDFTPLRNLFNEWYARDTSKKIRAVVKAKGMSGKRLSHLPPYGYIMGEDDNWMIDEETGPVVKEIFALCLSGLGPTRIANILTSKNLPTPGTINYRRYGNKQGYCPQAPCKWIYQTVSNILERVEYLGHTVNFKTTKKSYKSRVLSACEKIKSISTKDKGFRLITEYVVEDIYDFINAISLTGAEERFQYFDVVYLNGAFSDHAFGDNQGGIPKSLPLFCQVDCEVMKEKGVKIATLFVALLTELGKSYLLSKHDKKAIDAKAFSDYITA